MITWYLTGPKEGMSGIFGGVRFTEGKAMIPPELTDKYRRTLCRYYGAYPSTELIIKDGKRIHYSKLGKGKPEENKKVTPPPAQDSSLNVVDRIIAASKTLDVKDDTHWTQGGLPSMDYIKAVTGISDLKREVVTDMLGEDFNRAALLNKDD
jgi:hypothetical protein